MSQMDICLPAFAEFGYYRMQASSTFAMAVECNARVFFLFFSLPCKQLIIVRYAGPDPGNASHAAVICLRR